MQRTLDDFDFTAQPSINPDQVHALATARWIVNGENVLLLGPPGVGKTHLAIGLGHAATDADCSVLFVTAQSLMVQLHQDHEIGAWEACLARFVKPKLLIINEFVYLLVPPRTAHLLFQLAVTRYETSGILLTSNQGLADG